MGTKRKQAFSEETENRIQTWLSGGYDEETVATIEKLLEENPQELEDAFYRTLSFGTGGLRGIMGVGTNRINKYTIRAATQGLSNHLKKHFSQKSIKKSNLSVIIGYDSRHNSKQFAKEAASVLAFNGITAYLFDTLVATPLVSFGCRYYGCQAAIMVTASHNPPEYNGYKVYWQDGGQVLPPHDLAIIEEFNNISDPSSIETSPIPDPLIKVISEEPLKAYLSTIHSLQSYEKTNQEKGHELHIVYTGLHGTGVTIVPQTLKEWGFKQLTFVDEQMEPDGSFPTVASPNPEEVEAMKLGIKKLIEVEGDLLLATDPDSDRMGAIVLHEGKPFTLNGNQIGSLCLYHLCQTLSAKGRFPERAAFVKTIVTTELFKVIAESFGKPCFDVLPGFKYIASLIEEWERATFSFDFIFAAEESFGYLLGKHARDKDGPISCALLAEAALQTKLRGKTLVDLLYEMYKKFGIFKECLISLKFPETKEGREKMLQKMITLREDPPKSFNNSPIVSIEDYSTSTKKDLLTEETMTLHLPQSNILLFWLEDGSKVTVRPSGTEPKVKIYCGIQSKASENFEESLLKSDQQLKQLSTSVKEVLWTDSA